MSFKVCREGSDAQNYSYKAPQVFSKVIEVPFYDKSNWMAWFANLVHKMLWGVQTAPSRFYALYCRWSVNFILNFEKHFWLILRFWLFSPLYLGFQNPIALLPIWSILRNIVKEFESEILILSKEQEFLKYIFMSRNTHTYTVTWSPFMLILYKPDFGIFQHFLGSEIIFFLN